jgi:hypothetical protein
MSSGQYDDQIAMDGRLRDTGHNQAAIHGSRSPSRSSTAPTRRGPALFRSECGQGENAALALTRTSERHVDRGTVC